MTMLATEAQLILPGVYWYEVPSRCEVDGHAGFDFCIDTLIEVCFDCTLNPGLFGGIDHHLPGTDVICAHQIGADPWAPSGATESIRYQPAGGQDKTLLHWPAGRCWCDQFHRDQAPTIEFDRWRSCLSTFTPRPCRLG